MKRSIQAIGGGRSRSGGTPNRLPRLAACLACLATASDARSAAYDYRPVVLSGATAPGSGLGGDDLTLDGFGAPTFNQDGSLSFYGGSLGQNQAGGNQGVFVFDSEGLHTLAFEGQSVPASDADGGLVTITGLGGVRFNANGQAAVQLNTSADSAGGQVGLYVADRSGLQKVAFQGDLAFEGQRFTNFGLSSFNNQGQIAYRAETDGPETSNQGIFLGATPIAFESLQASITGSIYSQIADPVLGGGDALVYGATIRLGEDSQNVLYKREGGTLFFVDSQGRSIPGSGRGGPKRERFVSWYLSEAGHTVTWATAIGDDGSENGGLFILRGRGGYTLAYAGQTAPGSGGATGADVPFSGNWFDARVNASGEVVLAAATDPNEEGADVGLYKAVDGQLELLAFEGDPAPIPDDGGSGYVFSNFGVLAIGDAGEVYFRSFLDPVSDEGGARGKYGVFRVSDGVLDAVVYDGQALIDDDGVQRIVNISRSSALQGLNPEGQASGLGSDGQVALRLRFADGTEGIYIATPVPEPAAAGLTAAAVLLASWKRRPHPV